MSKARAVKAPVAPIADIVQLASEQHGLTGPAAINKLLTEKTPVSINTAIGRTLITTLPGGKLSELTKADPAAPPAVPGRSTNYVKHTLVGNPHIKSSAYPTFGPAKAKVLFLCAWPANDEVRAGQLGKAHSVTEFAQTCTSAGLDTKDVYYTTYVKSDVLNKKNTIERPLINLYKSLVTAELAAVDPELIVLVGARVVKAVFGDKITFNSLKGTIIAADKSPLGKPTTVILDPGSVVYIPENRQIIQLDLKRIADHIYDRKPPEPETNYVYCRTMAEAKVALEQLAAKSAGYIAVDCEWGGTGWKDGWLRCIQLCWAPGSVVVLVFANASPEHTCVLNPTELHNNAELWAMIKKIVLDNRLVGHFIRADLPWLIKAGIDVRASAINGWDTALAGHLLDENWTQGLEMYTARHTSIGRYEADLEAWRKTSKLSAAVLSEIGYASVPDEILLPYAAKDADATFRIFLHQMAELEKPDNTAIKALFHSIVMPATMPILEMEMTGMLVDKQRLETLSQQYTAKRTDLRNRLQEILNWPTFNPDSATQKRAALFGGTYPQMRMVSKAKKPGASVVPADAVLGTFTPSRTTKAMKSIKWDKAMALYTVNSIKSAVPTEFPPAAADKEQLKELIIQNKDSELLLLLRQYSAISQTVKTFTGSYVEEGETDDPDDIDDDEEVDITDGGLLSKTWSDGRVHTCIRQTVDTGRYGHTKPNMAQLPKLAEEFTDKIFANDIVKPESIRSCFHAEEGWCLLDNDWSGAELFVMAWLSGDAEMKKRLLRKNADFHSDAAIDMFRLAPMPADFVGDTKAWLKHNNWLRFRTIAKTIVFGIAYGRGAAAVRQAVYLEGVEITVDEAQTAINRFNETFPDLAAWLAIQQASVQQIGYVTNGFGRRRRFGATSDNETLAHQKRQAMNAPIQGTVGDLMSLALCNLYFIREYERPHLKFKILMSVHDQILLTCPIEQVAETVAVFGLAMCDRCKIPNYDLTLQAEPDVCLRWGKELTQADVDKYPALTPYLKQKKA